MARINRHAMKRKHKRFLEKKFARTYGYGSVWCVETLRDKLIAEANDDYLVWLLHANNIRNGGWEYWKTWYMSGRRGFAKKWSNKRVRQQYRQMIHNADHEDIIALRGSGYRDMYDYENEIF